ncbi:type II toxin-antitoxin system VapC family toxin [Variovorax sp. KK3]|uniref:type II toxin-antitoxin system VapC family toxin n=1 Tax=Variovorax sp. KK3 TaxID=1855728 RepID=UPI00097C5A6A|nr:type II toxin-antitoxin system VapC family toxin [Variovorax sp. KK3]
MTLVYMLDTNITSAAIRGEPAIEAKLGALPQEAWCISAITMSEHVYGLSKRPEARRLARLVQEFLQVADVLPWDRHAADAHGELRAELESAGIPIGHYDTMIAAHARALGLIVVTDNERHFGRVPRLSVENWLRR